MRKELIAPCGMNCGVCANYLAMQNNQKRKDFISRIVPVADHAARTAHT